MAERNERIREIYYYLRLDLDILDEKFDPREDPSLVFSVMKSEVRLNSSSNYTYISLHDCLNIDPDRKVLDG